MTGPAATGAVVAALLVAVIALRLPDTGGAPAQRRAPAAATATATATATPAVSLEVPAGDPERLAAQLDRAEAILRDPASSAADQQAAGRLEQLATRRLVRAGPRLRRRALAAMGADARATMRATIGAARAISVLVEPQPRFPTWRIVAPPAPRTLMRHFRSAQARTRVPWEYLAAIQFVETKFGRIDGVSSAGARGPMQFLPSTWARYGRGDITDQRDSIHAAARYLVANGAPGDMSRALFGYNPSRGYVRAIRAYAERMREDPRAFVGFYHWQVLYSHARGMMILPEGYPEIRPVRVPDGA